MMDKVERVSICLPGSLITRMKKSKVKLNLSRICRIAVEEILNGEDKANLYTQELQQQVWKLRNKITRIQAITAEVD